MALVYVKLTSKFVDVGFQNPLGSFYGYQTGTASNNFGQMSESANGAANNTTTNITGSTYTIERTYWQDYITDNLFYVVNGTQSNGGWTRLNIDGDLWSRNLANYSTTAISGKTRWFWNTSTNSFGTTTGADIPWNVELQVSDSLVSNSITNTSLSATQVANSVFTLNSAPVTYTQRYRIVLVSGTNADGDSPGALIGTGVTYDGSPAQSITIGNGQQPTAGNTCNYKVQVSGEFVSFTDSDAWADATGTNSTFSITRASGISPPIISSVTNNNAAASTVTATVNLSDTGANGTLKYAQTTSNSVPASGWQTSASFSHPRNSTRYYWASQDEDTSGAFDDSGAIFVGYLLPDTNISATPSVTSISSGYNSTVNVSITGMTAIDEYRLVTTDTNTPQVSGHQVDFGTGVTSDTFVIAANELPDVAGTSAGYKMQARRPEADGGDNGYDDTGDTFTITRQVADDNTPEGFTALGGDSLTSALNTQHYATFSGTVVGTTSPGTALALGTTIDNGTSISTSNGQWSTNGTTWNTSSSTVNQNQSVYFRGLSSSSSATNTTHSLTIGTVTHSFQTRTVGGGGTNPGSNDYGIEVYGPNGTTPVFTSDYRVANIAVNSSFSLNSGNSYSQTFTCDSAQDTNKIIILFDTGIYIYQQNLVVTRATNQFTLSYPTSTNVSGQVIALRFG